MLKFFGVMMAGMFVLVVAIVGVFISGFRINKDTDGLANISLFWGAIKVDEKNQKVNIFGDLVAVDGKNETVNVAGTVDVDGKSEVVNVANGDVVVDGKAGLVKVKKSILASINQDYVTVEKNKINSKLISSVLKLKSDGENLKIEGKKVGEDDVYIHLESSEKTKIKVDVKIGN